MYSKYAGNLWTIAALWKRMSSDFWPLVLSLFTWRALLKQRKLHIAFKCRSRELQYISVSGLYVPARLEICSAHPEWSALKLFFSFETWLFQRRIFFSCLFLFASFNSLSCLISSCFLPCTILCIHNRCFPGSPAATNIHIETNMRDDFLGGGRGWGGEEGDKFCNSLHPAHICKPTVIFRSQQCRLKPLFFICVRDIEQEKGRVNKKEMKSVSEQRD